MRVRRLISLLSRLEAVGLAGASPMASRDAEDSESLREIRLDPVG